MNLVVFAPFLLCSFLPFSLFLSFYVSSFEAVGVATAEGRFYPLTAPCSLYDAHYLACKGRQCVNKFCQHPTQLTKPDYSTGIMFGVSSYTLHCDQLFLDGIVTILCQLAYRRDKYLFVYHHHHHSRHRHRRYNHNHHHHYHHNNNFFFLWRCDPTRVMASLFLRFLDHTQRRSTVCRTPLDE